jgi:hypothetical protein
LADRAFGLGRNFTCQGNDLADLFSRNFGGGTGPQHIFQPINHTQFIERQASEAKSTECSEDVNLHTQLHHYDTFPGPKIYV